MLGSNYIYITVYKLKDERIKIMKKNSLPTLKLKNKLETYIFF